MKKINFQARYLMKKHIALCILGVALISFSSFNFRIGDIIDSYNDVPVYYNGSNYKAVQGRNTTRDGYNLGLKYQCVEYVKRYYYEVYNHKMPNSYGHAKDLFDTSLEDVAYNTARGLMQYRNSRYEMPKVGDILVYGKFEGNPFGHTGIISKVGSDYIELVQQNYGLKTRQELKLVEFMGIYTIADYDLYGWLRMP